MKINKKLLKFLSICIILLQINTLHIKNKKDLEPEKTSSSSEKSEPNCITYREIIPSEPLAPSEPSAPKHPLGFCEDISKEEKEKGKEEIILRKETEKKEDIDNKEIKPVINEEEKKEEIDKKEIKPVVNENEKEREKENEIISKDDDNREKEKTITDPKEEIIEKNEKVKEMEPKESLPEKIKEDRGEEITEEKENNVKADSPKDKDSYATIEHCIKIDHPKFDEEAIRRDIANRLVILDELRNIPTIDNKTTEKKQIEFPEEAKEKETIKSEIKEKEIEEPKEAKIKEDTEDREKEKPKVEEEIPKEKVKETETKEDLPLPVLRSKNDKSSKLEEEREIEEVEKEGEKERPKKEENPDHKKIASDILNEIRSELGIINFKEEKETESDSIKPNKNWVICKTTGKLVRECPCEKREQENKKRILEKKVKEIKGKSFIQLNSNQDDGKTLTGKTTENVDDFIDKTKTIARSGSTSDSSINANALNNSVIKGTINTDSNQTAIATSSNNSGAASNVNGIIKSISNLNADDNSNIENTSNLNSIGRAISKADNDSFAIADSKEKNSLNSNIDAKGNSKVFSIDNLNTSANSDSNSADESIARTTSGSEGNLNNDLNASKESEINTKSNLDSRANAKVISEDSGNGIAISDSNSIGNVKGIASDKSKLDLDLNNKDSASSEVNSNGNVGTKKLDEITPKIVPGNEADIEKMPPFLRRGSGEEKPKRDFDCFSTAENEYKKEKENVNGNKSMDEKIDEIIENGKKEKISPSLKADIEKIEIKEIIKDEKILDEIQKEKKEKINENGKILDTSPIYPTEEIKPEIKSKPIIIDIKDCKGPSEEHKFDYNFFDGDKTGIKLRSTVNEDVYKHGGEIRHPKYIGDGRGCDFDIHKRGEGFGIHSNCPFDHEFFRTDSLPRESPRILNKDRTPHPIPFCNQNIHNYSNQQCGGFDGRGIGFEGRGIGFEGRGFPEAQGRFPRKLKRSGKRHGNLRRRGGPIKRKLREPQREIIDGGMNIPDNRREISPYIREDKFPRKDLDIFTSGKEESVKEIKDEKEDKKISSTKGEKHGEDGFKVGEKEINYEKVCNKICVDKNLPKNQGSESKTGTNGVTYFRCTCGEIKTKWFKSGNVANDELQVEEVESDSIGKDEVDVEKKEKKPEGILNGINIDKQIDCGFKIEIPKINTDDLFKFNFNGKEKRKEKDEEKVDEKPQEKVDDKINPILRADKTRVEEEREKDFKEEDFIGKKSEVKPIDMKEHVGNYIDKNANKIKGVSAHFLDSLDSLQDRKLKEYLN
jgi:hypothetical protein